MRRKISKLLERAAGAHRPEHRAKLEKALREARSEEEAEREEEERRERERFNRWWRRRY